MSEICLPNRFCLNPLILFHFIQYYMLRVKWSYFQITIWKCWQMKDGGRTFFHLFLIRKHSIRKRNWDCIPLNSVSNKMSFSSSSSADFNFAFQALESNLLREKFLFTPLQIRRDGERGFFPPFTLTFKVKASVNLGSSP